MKIIPLSLLLVSCIPQPIVQAPQMIVVEAVSSVPIENYPEEPKAKPVLTVKWEVNPIIPLEENSENYFEDSYTGSKSWSYKRGIFRATFTINSHQLEFSCAEQEGRLLNCDAEMEVQNLACGNDMLFSVVCKREDTGQ